MSAAGPGGRRTRTASPEQTEALGRDLAAHLQEGDLVLIDGELGAGKTAFVRGLAAGLGADPGEVSSPTFTLMQEYRGRVVLRHLDLYRVTGAAEIDDLAVDEAGQGAVVAVEWAERLGEAPSGAWRVTIRVVDEETRDIEIVSDRSR